MTLSNFRRRCNLLVSSFIIFTVLGVVVPGVVLADSTPPLSWTPVVSEGAVYRTIVDPAGNVTLPCNNLSQDLVTYNSSGIEIRRLSRTSFVDGVSNCMDYPVVDEEGTLYGVPYGEKSSGGWGSGPNLLAYDNNTIRWKYPVECGTGTSTQVVGADGNIYLTTIKGDGLTHLIGLDPELSTGSTSPEEVFDLELTGGCGHEIFAYDEGIVLYGSQYSGKAIYYSYSGKRLTEAPATYTIPVFSASGKRFYQKQVISGSSNTATVTMFDPTKGRTAWQKQVSTPGAYVQWMGEMVAMPGDRSAIIFREEEMIADNMPSGSGEFETVLAILSSDGSVAKRHVLPDYGDGGHSLVDTSMKATQTGLVVSRTLDKYAGSGWNARIPEIIVTVLDANGNVVSGGGTIRGDTTSEASRYGYHTSGEVSVSDDTIFVLAGCMGNCSFAINQVKIFPISATNIGMEYPVGDVLASDVEPQASPKKYVAMGDSFSSGEGVLPFEEGTDEPGDNECHRSIDAYANILARDPAVSAELQESGFVACSGAVTSNVSNGGSGNGSWDEAPQINRLTSDTDIVTLTVGGNDVGFTSYVIGCTVVCGPNTPVHTAMMNGINAPAFKSNLKSTYESILEEAPTAQVYVSDYPYMSSESESTCESFDFSGVRDIQIALNSVIESAIAETESNRIHYVDTNALGSPFAGKHLCGNDSYFNGVAPLPVIAHSFHPNKKGQMAYASLFKSAMEN